MKNKTYLQLFLVAVMCWAQAQPLAAQQHCQPPALPGSGAGQNIFSAEQEMDLGDAIAEHVQRDYRVIDDPEVTAYLRRIGERLTRHLPPTNLRFQFFLFDLNDVNAFTLPGGRIYVSRKMVAFAQNEDELAGVIAHELGHIVARHSAIDMTVLFREVLGVTQVTDRRDIFARYNQLIENAARKQKVFEKLDNHEEGDQNVADLIGLYVMSRAGYDPQAQASLWDRYHELKGKTGGFLSDLFGRSKPGQKRFREMLKSLASLPPDCIGARIATGGGDFRQWQTAVVSYTGLVRKESLPGVLVTKTLTPPLRSDVNHMRFSPDGKFLLAQDDSGINVLTREPLAPLFRISTPEARPALFTPDSRQIVLYTANLRIETWDIAEQKLKSAQEVVVRKTCLQTELSSDGKTLACLDSDFGLNLVEVATGNVLMEKKSFSQMGFSDAISFILSALLAAEDIDLGQREFINMAFSPDSHYFVAGDRSLNFTAIGTLASETQSLAFDLTTRSAVPLKGDIKKIIGSGFGFVGSDKLVGRNFENSKKSGLYSFPSGQVIENFEIFSTSYVPVTSGNYVLLTSMGKLSGGLMDLSTRQVTMVNNRPVLDAYGDVVASEQRNGELGLYSFKGGPPKLTVLPANPLGRLYAVDVTPDFKWLAVSGYSRGAVWDLTQGNMVFYLRGFRGAYLGDDKIFYSDFPKFAQAERNMARLNLATKETSPGPPIEDSSALQGGAYVLRIKPAKKGGGYWENVVMEVLDSRTLSPMWSATFPKERPRYWMAPRDGTITMSWPVKSKAAAAEIKSSPALTQQMNTLKEKEGDYFIKVLDVKTGQALGQLLIETGKGSFRVKEVFTTGDWVVVSDTENRTLVYSLSSGQQVGKVFGRRPAVSAASGLLCIEKEEGVLVLHDLASFEKRQQYSFTSRISVLSFSPDGKRLFVLTANQTFYVLDVSSFAGPKPA